MHPTTTKIGKKYKVLKINKFGERVSPTEQKLPKLSLLGSYDVIVKETMVFANYRKISDKILNKSPKHLQTLKEVLKFLTFRYKTSRPEMSKRDIGEAKIVYTKLEII